MRRTLLLPPDLSERARAYARGEQRPVRPRDAATVVLLRAAPAGPAGGVEAYLLRRHRQMSFAAGMYAFPGGGVDPRDADTTIRWCGPAPRDWAERLSCDESLARALVCAAVRETFEESGVLLAGTTPDTVVPDTSGDDWEQDRRSLVAKELGFADFLVRRDLMLRSDLLAAWSHWITPEFEPRRFDTRFFVAVLPSGQHTRDVSGEADRVAWLRPADVVSGADAGELAMLPPTYVTMQEMSALQDPAAALTVAESRTITPVEPAATIDGDRAYLTVELG
ncbi:MAG: NUDIX hydrolase [Propionibacteriales bacterium]|nr:NUDIX hydrolase [Propionibacteriales bacterium]